MSLFRSVDLNGDGFVSKEECLRVFSNAGMADNDPRFKSVYENLKEYSDTKKQLDFDSLHRIFGPNAQFIQRIFRGELVIPDFDLFKLRLEQLFEAARHNTDGEVATYIPELARVDWQKYGAAACTVDGQRCHFGDSTEKFTIQSISKTISYCLALEQHGIAKVHTHVGREPSGLGFNELTLDAKGLPHNPMINAGAIMTCSLIAPELPLAQRVDFVRSAWEDLSASSPIRVNESVYQSESQTAHRNRALSHYMMEKGAFPEWAEIEETLALYFNCCSLEMNCEQLSVVAATLANGGVSPITNQRLLKPETVQSCLSLMTTCGMYDYSGEWAFSIGLPAKSGVAGGLMVVVPNVLGVCIWSPKLDKQGNSVRGIEFTKRLLEEFSLHHFDNIFSFQKKTNPLISVSQHLASTTSKLIEAAANGDLVSVERLCNNGLDVNSKDYDFRTPLHMAAREGHINVLHHLIDSGAFINATDRWGYTALDEAQMAKQGRCVDVLIGSGGQPGAIKSAQHPKDRCATKMTNDEAGFLWAAAAGNVDNLCKHIARGVDIHAFDYDGRTALHVAAASGHLDAYNYLVAQGADINRADCRGLTPSDEAARAAQT